MDQLTHDKEKEETADKGDYNPEQPSPHQGGKNSPITNRNENGADDRQRKNWLGWIQAISTVAIVFIIAFYTYYARQQVKETGRAIARTDASIKLDQRAWIGVTSVSGKPEVGKQLAITVTFQNTGKTPAKNTNIAAVVEPAHENKAPDFTLEKRVRRESKGLVTPQGETFSTLVIVNEDSPSGELNDAALKDITEGELRIYAHGIVEYDDVFGTHHWATYCFYLNPGGKHKKGYSGYSACKEHNDTDSD